jgi:hypothetical protein
LALTAAGTTGQVLTSQGTSAPIWSNNSATITVTDDTSSATVEYPTLARITTGSLNTVYTSSTKLSYVSSTGTLSATVFSGSGASLTSIPNSALNNSTISGISLGSNLATLTIGTGLSGTSYNGSTGVTIANSGVLSITGTASQITASASTGAVTLSLPSTINVNTSGTAANVTGTVVIANGGTNITTYTTGDILYASATNTLSKLAIGTNGYHLTVTSGLPVWKPPYVRTSFTATASQTTFSATYNVGYVQVFVNGVLLNGADYTATNGTSVVLAVGCNASDIVETIAYNV